MAKMRTKSKSICGLCKPHKNGWSDKHKPKYRAAMEANKKEVLECRY